MIVSVSDLAPCPYTPIQTSEERENVNLSGESMSNGKKPVFDVFKIPPLPEQTAENLPAELSAPNTVSSISPVSEDVLLDDLQGLASHLGSKTTLTTHNKIVVYCVVTDFVWES